MRMRLLAALLCCSTVSWAAGQVPPSFKLAKSLSAAPRTDLPALDLQALAVEDAVNDQKSQPWRYAVALPVADIRSVGGESSGGVWTDLGDGRRMWRFEVDAAGAKTVDLRFAPYRLPHDAELWVYTPDRSAFSGPYTDQHNNREQLLATPVLPGGRVIVEVVVPADRVQFMDLALQRVNSGYRGFEFVDGLPIPKSGSCNVDTICPQGDAFRNEIQAVLRYTADGGLCTGTLMNNTRQDGTPLLLTARHCFDNQTAAAGLVAYYNYTSPTCRATGSTASGTPVSVSVATHTQTGSTLLASSTRADFTLVRLNQSVPSGANPYFAGWDRSNQAPSSVTGIHHPQGDEKRISFENDPLSITTSTVDLGGGLVLGAGDALRINDWDLGTTEQGSSGSAIFSPNKLVVGTLSGGFAACGNNLEDYYGRLFTSFTGGGTSSSRLSDHLDPTGSGVQTLSGRAPGSSNGCTLSATISQTPNSASVRTGVDVAFTATISGGTAPYSLSWDLDGDGVAEQTRSGLSTLTSDITARYNQAKAANVALTVSDAGACQSTTQRAINVVSSLPTITSPQLVRLSGFNDGDNEVEPGETWRMNVPVSNSGSVDIVGGQVVFARASSDSNLRVITPAVALPATVAAGASATVAVDFYIQPAASCATQHTIQYVGVVDSAGVSGSAANINLPVSTSCVANSSLPAPSIASPSFRNGAFFNTGRSGNGLISYLIPQTNASPVFYAQWFTADDQRRPVWYYIQTSLVDGQARGNIVRRTRNVAAPGLTTSDEVIGTAQITVLGNETLLFTHQLTGQPRGGDRLVHLLGGLAAPSPNRTGAWYNVNEAGWGQTYDSYVLNGTPTEFALTYVYDSAGQPRWLTSGNFAASASSYEALATSRVHCPNCVWVNPSFSASGTVTRQFTTTTTGTASTNLTVPVGGTWVRNNVPITLLTTPQP